MSTPSPPGNDGEPGEDRGGGRPQKQESPARADSPPTFSAAPVVLDDDDGDYDDELGGRAALDLDAPSGRRRGRGAPLDLNSLIGEFEAGLQQQEQERARQGNAATPPIVSQAVRAPDTSARPLENATSSPADTAEIARLRDEVQAERGNLRRAQADLVNARRKAEQERTRAVQEATERVIRQFFPLFDDFERGLITTRESRGYDQLSSGVEGILRNADALLARYGVVPTQSVGQLFDPTLHEAIGVVETADVPEETVVEELRKGYTLGDRLLRAAMVRVARHPAAPAEDADTDIELDEGDEEPIEIA